MTHPGDGDVSDDGRRKRRRRRRGRRGKNLAASSNAQQLGDATGTRSSDAAASNVNTGASTGSGAANETAASGKRKARSRRRKSSGRAKGAAGKPSSGNVQSATTQSGTQSTAAQSAGRPSGSAPERPGQLRPEPLRDAKAKRAGNAQSSGTLRPVDAKGGTDVPAVVDDSTGPATATRTDAANGAPNDAADVLAARRARADRETSAGGIVYRVHNGEALFLIIRDSYRNWGFPKGHLEGEELPDAAAIREVQEETGLVELKLDGAIETIDWFFRFRGRLVHKVCHFYLMRTESSRTVPQREEGITACRWARFEEATRLISYANARSVLSRANAMVLAGSGTHADADAHATSHAHTGAQSSASTNAADAARD